MRSIQPRVFDYVDAMPGSGKTEFFVRYAAEILNSKGKHNLVYVAPTIRLLVEAYRRVLRHVDASAAKRIHIVATYDQLVDHLKHNTRPLIYKRSPKVVLNHLLGLANSEQGYPEPIKAGTIIMTTHESFVQVAHADITGNDFAILRKTDVIFDEARHCILDSKPMKDVSNESLLNLRRCFDLTFVDTALGDKSPWHVYSVTNAPSRNQLKEIFQVASWRSIPKSIRDLRQAVEVYSDSGRASLYMLTNVKTVNLLSTSTRNAILNLYTVLRPTGLFDYYRNVTLTSAFFKDSQMYHFLKLDGHQFRDMKGVNDLRLAPVYKRDEKLRRALSKRLLVGTLLEGGAMRHKLREYKNTLTSNLLENGIVCPLKLQDHAHRLVFDDLESSAVINTAYARKPVSNNSAFNRTIQKYAQPPLWVLIKEAAAIIDSQIEAGNFSKPEGPQDYSNLALLVLNVSHKVWGAARVPYSYTVRKLYTEGTLKNKSSAHEEMDAVYSKENKRALATTPKDLEAELTQCLHIASKDRKFIIPASNRLHGINLYSSLKAFVHLAALNPTPQLISFYRILLGSEYDIDQDHSIENLVQMLYRTNLRDPNATDKVLMIVPYATQALLLQEKIGCSEFTYINQPRLTPWTFKRAVEPNQRKAIAAVAGKASGRARASKFANADPAKVHSCRCSISNYRAKIKKNPDSKDVKKWEAKIVEFQERLEALKKD